MSNPSNDERIYVVYGVEEHYLVEDYLDHLTIDPQKSFKGWLTTLTKEEFTEVFNSFENPENKDTSGLACMLILARLSKNLPTNGMIVSEIDYGNYRLVSNIDVTSISLYRKGYVELASRGEEGWIFKLTEKGETFLKQTDGHID